MRKRGEDKGGGEESEDEREKERKREREGSVSRRQGSSMSPGRLVHGPPSEKNE